MKPSHSTVVTEVSAHPKWSSGTQMAVQRYFILRQGSWIHIALHQSAFCHTRGGQFSIAEGSVQSGAQLWAISS